MTTFLYSGLDTAKILKPNGTLLVGSVAGTSAVGTTFWGSDGSIVHASIPVPAGTSFIVEASTGTSGGQGSTFGLGDNNTLLAKQLRVPGGAELVQKDGVGVPGTTSTLTSATNCRIDFYANTGRVVVYVNSVLRADILVPSLIGRPIYVFGSSTIVGTGIVFNFGRSTFTTQQPVPAVLQAGVYIETSATATAWGPRDNSVPGSELGVVHNPMADLGSILYPILLQKDQVKTILPDPTYEFYSPLQGGAGSVSEGTGTAYLAERMGSSVSTRGQEITAGKNTKSRTSAFEQQRPDEIYIPKVYWGDS